MLSVNDDTDSVDTDVTGSWYRPWYGLTASMWSLVQVCGAAVSDKKKAALNGMVTDRSGGYSTIIDTGGNSYYPYTRCRVDLLCHVTGIPPCEWLVCVT